MPVPTFKAITSSPDFTGEHALGMLQTQYTIDYGGKRAGSRPASVAHEYYPTFHLDMLAFVGQPLKPITRHNEEQFFDNVTVTFGNWLAPYSSKHNHGIPFELDHRTFRIATAASRDSWFIVMHPVVVPMRELPTTWRDIRLRSEKSSQHSAMRVHHARRLAGYIRHLFGRGELVGKGVEPSWVLGGRQARQMEFNVWTKFQVEFMSGWAEFVEENVDDEFWTSNRPAFHAYDYGADIHIEVTEQLSSLPREGRLRTEGDSDGEDDEMIHERADGESVPASSSQSTSYTGGSGGSAPSTQASAVPVNYEQLYEGRLGVLRRELEGKYILANIGTVCYALAANINCAEGGAAGGGDEEEEEEEGRTRCLLANRNVVHQQFVRGQDYLFYPLGFHPSFGNFTSRRPPQFLEDRLLVMQENMSYQNGGMAPLTFGHFQAYSNIKRSIRHDSAALLATKGAATAAVTLPPSEAALCGKIRKKREQLLAAMQGQSTPDDPSASKPFAREARQLDAAIEAEEYAFRMEQVLSIDTRSLLDERRTFTTVLNPIFELMRFFLKEPARYSRLLYAFRPAVFPGVLSCFTRMLGRALDELVLRAGARQFEDIGVSLAEGVALIDRVGNYCLTGASRALMGSVMRPLGTIDGIQHGAWPYIKPGVLSLASGAEGVVLANWPYGRDGRPLLMHLASLRFHYGLEVAARRSSSLWFRDFGSLAICGRLRAAEFVTQLVEELWIAETTMFLREQAERAARTGSRAAAQERVDAVQRWCQAESRFRWR